MFGERQRLMVHLSTSDRHDAVQHMHLTRTQNTRTGTPPLHIRLPPLPNHRWLLGTTDNADNVRVRVEREPSSSPPWPPSWLLVVLYDVLVTLFALRGVIGGVAVVCFDALTRMAGYLFPETAPSPDDPPLLHTLFRACVMAHVASGVILTTLLLQCWLRRQSENPFRQPTALHTSCVNAVVLYVAMGVMQQASQATSLVIKLLPTRMLWSCLCTSYALHLSLVAIEAAERFNDWKPNLYAETFRCFLAWDVLRGKRALDAAIAPTPLPYIVNTQLSH